MSHPADSRLQRLLGGEKLAALRRRLRQRFERAAPDAAKQGFRLSNLNPDEHAALAALLGRSPRFSGSMSVDVQAVDAALARAGIAGSLREALEHLDGPIVNLAARRSLIAAQWARVREPCDHPGLAHLLRTPSGVGLLKRLSGQQPEEAACLLHRAQEVLRRLPARGLTRAQLAADVLGDAHALDTGNPVATLVLAALRQTTDTDQEEGGTPEESGGNTARDLWAAVGVLVNELARPALVLNLPLKEGCISGACAGEPAYLSLRTLLRSPPAWQVAGRDIYVCENPNLLAIAADRLGPRCAPLVCTDGMPAAAQRSLLAQLARAGGRLHYHGDFDWPGLRIANHVMDTYGAHSWRFATADYLAAAGVAPRPGRRLEGIEVAALWDANLAPAMAQHQLAIDEEAVAQHLLLELAPVPARDATAASLEAAAAAVAEATRLAQ